MAPLRPAAFRSLTSQPLQLFDDDDNITGVPIGDFNIQQFGRTATPLAAQNSAQSLRQASRKQHCRRYSKASSSPDLRCSKIPVIDITAANVAQARRTAPHVPLISSPLCSESVPADTSIWDEEELLQDTCGQLLAERTKKRSRPRSKSAEVLNSPKSREHTRDPDDGFLKPPVVSSRPRRSYTTFSQLSQPRSVRDLGSDYTRYFNPFATPTPSCQDLRAAASIESASAEGDDSVFTGKLSKRHSNPFDDSKRSSLLSLQDAATVPAAHQSKTNEHAGGLTLLTVPARADTPYFIHDADPEKAAFFQYVDDRLGAPPSSFPYMNDPKEDDDDFHMPEWDDDVKLKPKFKEHFSRENIMSTFGLLLMFIGLTTVFIVLPVVSYTGWSMIDYQYETPFDQILRPWLEHDWYWVNDRHYPLMRNVRHGLIDRDTPTSAMTRKSVTGETLKLVFSDEFNEQDRTFYPGDDPYWYAFDGWYGATQDMEWYDPDALNTGNGTLSIQLDEFLNHDLPYRSGMLNSWNQLCFKGGVFEVSMSLPGPAGVHGLWPGVWTMGNLGRPGYLATTDGLWPYTYNTCDVGITPNQSTADGTSSLPGQRLTSCTCEGEDHPTPGKGRGAPEIDIAEVSADWSELGLAIATQSFQVAPFDVWWRPDYDYMETPNYNVSAVNSWTGGPFQQAVSTTTSLSNDWYDDIEYQKFAVEYRPGTDENAFVAWTIGQEEMMRFDARAIGPNGNIGQREISEEPMSIIINLGLSHNWVDIDFAALKFPTVMWIDYVRWYQREGEEMVTCDPPGYETTEYIRRHPGAYRNPNVTLWEDAGYTWPTNSFMHGCEAAEGEREAGEKG